MINYDLTGRVERYYGSKHFSFFVLNANNLTLPLNLSGGEVINLPPRASTAKLAEASARRKRATSRPV